ncbi:DsbA family oxidoreductase [Burkholderia cenocepacia]|uniref:DsbA family oxidoreductase n=1 Tax=Burkholderia cenocepacia TaxID=95486 RepID=A0ABD4ULU1_9BURK|nr:DsbA family oxidoreductase [Burkholderia cenocepacia]MCW3698907.1 DsbA family oxidoreductase [Burkholderia cenocepacia]MCW3706525.1 DsbA family oxidoreductase [Burkholderia cenocepacia]MCW3714984.1 DsbA family oxidoreductase [Burkholderia cenocepacia]MCW3722700.1 DsbA family oxidoreductase [Burkholderia cenocepacia]MCW3729754.1 DsbA family oxidoreductase [Burkholderia cenocepacia]
MKKITVDVWSDFVCPWCWIAKKRLERAIENLPAQVQIVVTNKAYRIARGLAPMDFRQALLQKFGSESSARSMMQAVADNGAMEGLVYNFNTMRFGDTADAHALVKGVESADDQHALIEVLMKSSITDGLNIFDRGTLKDIALQTGIPEAVVEACVFEHSKIEHDEMEANRVANGVPLFVFNSKFYLSGAQPLEVFQQALNRAIDAAPEEVSVGSGPSCDMGGCRI